MSKDSLEAFAKGLVKLAEYEKTINSRVKAGYERFALVKVAYKHPIIYVTDFFDSNKKLELPKQYLDHLDNFDDGEIMLINDNGTQFNCHKKIKTKWETTFGLGLLTNDYIIWEEFIGKCKYLDFTLGQVWGTSKDGHWIGSHTENLNKIEKLLYKTNSQKSNGEKI